MCIRPNRATGMYRPISMSCGGDNNSNNNNNNNNFKSLSFLVPDFYALNAHTGVEIKLHSFSRPNLGWTPIVLTGS
jgi:hypothetical protein